MQPDLSLKTYRELDGLYQGLYRLSAKQARERGPTHPFLCDVKSLSVDLFIKPRLNSALSQKGFVVLIVLNENGPIKIHYRHVYHEGADPLVSSCVTSKQISLEKLFSFNDGHMYEFKNLICRSQKENKPFSSGKSK